MRTPIDALFPRIRQAILAQTLLQPAPVYLTDLARRIGVPPSSLQRELAGLVGAGILKNHRDGNRVYYQPDQACPFLPELRGLLLKTAGLVDHLRQALEPFRQEIDVAFIYGSLARGEELSTSDVDLLLIGRVMLEKLAPALRSLEEDLGRPVNPTIYRPQEFSRKRVTRNHFLHTVLGTPRIFVMGSESDLERVPTKKEDA